MITYKCFLKAGLVTLLASIVFPTNAMDYNEKKHVKNCDSSENEEIVDVRCTGEHFYKHKSKNNLIILKSKSKKSKTVVHSSGSGNTVKVFLSDSEDSPIETLKE